MQSIIFKKLKEAGYVADVDNNNIEISWNE